MPNHHFLSYSSHDAADFALHLCDKLAAGPPTLRIWLDKRQLKPGQDWDSQLVEAIRTCDALLFVLTPDSVEDQSVCKQEWTRALKYKKPIVPLRLHHEAELPFRLEPRQFIDFSGDFDSALARLREHLRWLTTPAGQLQALQDRLADAHRDLRRATDANQQGRIANEIAELEEQVTRQRQIVADPAAAAARVEESIQRGLERERQPARPLKGVARSKFIHPPPAQAPGYFQDRHIESRLVGDFLRDESRTLLTVTGRGGIGKTAMVCRVLKALEQGHLPDEGGALAVAGILYLSETGSHRVNAPNLLAGIGQLLPATEAERLDALCRDPKIATGHKVNALLAVLPPAPTVVLLDNLETLIDPENRSLTDSELDEALRTLLAAPPHPLKVIITTRLAPRALLLHHPARQMPLNLDAGLETPYAENILRALDADGTLGLQAALPALLAQARVRTRGYPRALEALFAILAADRETTLVELLASSLPENVVQALVGEAFSRLDQSAQLTMAALAVYGRPVSPVAVDYLLQPYRPGLEGSGVLNRLVNMHFARKEEGRYSLHPVDQEYALTRLAVEPAAGPAGAEAAPDLLALRRRAADFFRQARRPRTDWRTRADLEPQLAEFDLLCAAQDYDRAANVLGEIDFDYLLLWGHAQLLVELHGRLLGRLSDQPLTATSLGNLGSAYYSLGQVEQAIRHYQQALIIAREIGDRRGEGADLGNLGLAYYSLGQVEQAIRHHQQALAIAREIGDRRGEGADLGNLGLAYYSLGQVEQAIRHHQQALAIAREIGDRRGEGNGLGALSLAYYSLGQVEQAIRHYQQALAIAREIGNRYMESLCHVSLGQAQTDQGDFTAAQQAFLVGHTLADAIGYPECQIEARLGQAICHLLAGQVAEAALAARAAGAIDYPSLKHQADVVLGVAALRQGDGATARSAFAAAITLADSLLAHTPHLYAAQESKGLALCGLALLGEQPDLTAASAAYRTASRATLAPGIVGRAVRRFAALAVADGRGLLESVRPLVAGDA